MEQRETAGITIRLIIEQVRREVGEPGVERMLEIAGETRPLAVLESPRVWHSVATRRLLFAAGTEVTGDPQFATRVGASILSSRGSALLRAVLSRLGSPGGLLKALPMAHSKFDTACETRLVHAEAGHALVEFRTKPGYSPSPYDCSYAMGLFSQLTVLFGMAPALVAEAQCQSKGAPHCIFEISWGDRRSHRSHRSRAPGGRRERARSRLEADPGHTGEPEDASVPGSLLIQVQLEDLQAAVADLLDAREVSDVVAKVAEHAGSAVTAQQLLLAVRVGERGPIEIQAEGLEAARALQMGTDLLENGELAVPLFGEGPSHVLVAQVRSADRDYGKLVAFSNASFIEGEQQLLDSYARLAATALDACVALDMAETRRHTAEILGAFAASLIRVQDTAGVAAATARAAREIVSSDRSIVLRHLEESGSLATVCHLGYDTELAAALDVLIVTNEDTPELSKMLMSPDVPRIYERANADEYVKSMMDAFGVDCITAVAIRSSDRLFGVLVAAWEKGPVLADLRDLARQVAAIADQAAGAWEKAVLIEQIHHQASIDPLTGLANRRVFTETLASLLARRTEPGLAVLFCDIDRFKAVNDVLGHAAGDELLIAVGRRLQHCVRSDDLVARLGGDEFTILLADVGPDWSPEVFAEKVWGAMSEPIEIEGSQVVVHLSIGAIAATPGQSSVKDILRCADAAMYEAKTRGGNRLLTFEEEMARRRSERIALEAGLAEAVADMGQFLVLYEPQVDIASGDVLSAEALVRWQHPALGLLSPDRFLAVAEETGLIVPIDLHVLRSALREAASWRAAGRADLHVAVNFSVRTLTSADLVGTVGAELAAAGVPGESLEIELTESTVIIDPAALSQILLELGCLGVSVAIDDVGTGYSSLALLRSLPAQTIKIDQSFVQAITDDRASRAVVEAVLLLAERLGQNVVAEGIETAGQALVLQELGCRRGQGYLYARPGSARDLMKLAARGAFPVSAR
ncbi:MAG: EAL domain-containing protein [Acidimicrobiales bacterium]